MDKKIMYAAIAVVLIVLVAGVAIAATGGEDDTKETGDTYYLFLDGISEDKIGWYTGTGANPDEGYRNALDNSKIPYEVNSDGWIISVDGKTGTDNTGFGVFANTSTNVSEPAAYTFVTGPVLTHVYSNVTYMVYSEWSYSEAAGMTYAINPSNTKAADFLTGGPFADKDYKPLDYGDTYSIFLDGMGDLNGWYTATGDNILDALDNALTEKKIAHDFNVENGFINSIGDNKSEKPNGFGVYSYLSDVVSPDNAYCFLAGPVLNDAAGNIGYVTFGDYVASWPIAPNPTHTTTEGFLTGGPFATA